MKKATTMNIELKVVTISHQQVADICVFNLSSIYIETFEKREIERKTTSVEETRKLLWWKNAEKFIH